MDIRYVTIVPTGKADEAGFMTGIVTEYDKRCREIVSWESDNFLLQGNFQCDFEADGGIKIWGMDDKPIEVVSGYTTKIYDSKNRPV